MWRRRKCRNCGFSYTTQERLVLDEVLLIRDSHEDHPYSQGGLIAGIIKALEAVGAPSDQAYWLAQTVEERLLRAQQQSKQWQPVTTQRLNLITYDTLSAYHPVAAAAYAAAHKLETKQSKLFKRKRRSI
ncbi:MAG: hypothetical protein EOT04_01355 [Candidatus Chaera renei]|uniref:ATP-cone domain-containing protein n=1 Tax=Candidatus Chaera renei TaxID=2506947 RepID=A0A4Q0AJD7_9BACT|nr:MAG: hypothetical protein EOT04_01355 [Candidatus Chaera renei]